MGGLAAFGTPVAMPPADAPWVEKTWFHLGHPAHGRDWREVHEILKPFVNVTNIHGHTHQVLYNEIGRLRSIGMLATSWPWPYAPEGVPVLTRPMVRADPGDHFDGVGWSALTLADGGRVDNEYRMWRKDVYATAPVDSGTEDNRNQVLSPRIADRI